MIEEMSLFDAVMNWLEIMNIFQKVGKENGRTKNHSEYLYCPYGTGYKKLRFPYISFPQPNSMRISSRETKTLCIVLWNISLLYTSERIISIWKQKFELEFCKIKNTANFIRTSFDANGKFEKFVIFTETMVEVSFKHEVFTVKEKDEKFIRIWLSDPNMRCYDDADIIPPPLVCPPNIFNMWRIFPWECLPEEDLDMEGVKMFFNHLEILCNHDKQAFDYVCMWLA